MAYYAMSPNMLHYSLMHTVRCWQRAELFEIVSVVRVAWCWYAEQIENVAGPMHAPR